MLSVSPMDMGIVAVVALVVLGPDKLPTAMRSAGKLWRDFNGVRARLEAEARETFGELPINSLNRFTSLGSNSSLGAASLRTAMRTGAAGLVGSIASGARTGSSSTEVSSEAGTAAAVGKAEMTKTYNPSGQREIIVQGETLIVPFAGLLDLDNPICN